MMINLQCEQRIHEDAELAVHWFLPTDGDGRYLASAQGARAPAFSYLRQVATAADELGYFGILLPSGQACQDPWVTAAALVPLTQRLKFLLAVRPGLSHPSMTARMANSLNRFSGGRLLVNAVAGGDPVELRGDGISLGHDDRYAAMAEYLHIWRALIGGQTVDFHGKHYSCENARLSNWTEEVPSPAVYIGGSSAPAQSIAVRQCDVYLAWGEPIESVKAKIEVVRKLASVEGRRVRFGIRLHVIVRETSDAAWREAEKLIGKVTDEQIAAAKLNFSRFDSHGQRAMADLSGGGRDNLVVGKNLWAGVGLVRGGAATALVGSPFEIAGRIKELMEIGISEIILSGYPHLEECYRFAELVFPLLPISREASSRVFSGKNTGPFSTAA